MLERLCLILGCRHFPSHFSWMLAVAIWIWWNSNAKRVQDGAGGWFRNFCWPSFLVPSALYLQQFGTRICHFAWYLLHFGMVTLHFAWYVLHLAMFAFHFAWYLPRFGTSTSHLHGFATFGTSNVHVGFLRVSLGFHLGFHLGGFFRVSFRVSYRVSFKVSLGVL